MLEEVIISVTQEDIDNGLNTIIIAALLLGPQSELLKLSML